MFQQPPKSITANGTLNKEGVDLEESAEIKYADNKVANLKISALNTLKNRAEIVGTKGKMTLGLRYEADVVRKCIREGKTESEHVTHKESLLIACIEDEIRKQIGVTYPADE